MEREEARKLELVRLADAKQSDRMFMTMMVTIVQNGRKIDDKALSDAEIREYQETSMTP
jgi:hypothetical protein